MKNNKVLVIICIILLNLLVGYMIGQAFLGQESAYDKSLRLARECVEQDLCLKAVNYYNEALKLDDSLEVRLEMIPVYERAVENGEVVNAYTIYTAVEDIVELYPGEMSAYEAVCSFYEKQGMYEDCATYLMQAEDQNLVSDALAELRERVRYEYKLGYTTYEQITSQYDGSYLVQMDNTYSWLDEEFSSVVEGKFSYASSFSEGYAFARKGEADGEFLSYVIDKAGIRQCYLEGVAESSGVGKGTNAEGETVLLLAGKSGDRYQYYDLNGKAVFGDYLFAGRFRNNIAAVQEAEGQWKLINAQGEPIVDTVFEDVILNEFDECAPKGRIFAKVNGKYHLYDMAGAQIGDFSCDDARAFIEDVTAFKSGEVWGFVNANGEVVMQPRFEDAKAFSKGLAAVKEQGIWCFADSTGKIVLTGDYEETGYLGSNGKCLVKINGHWAVLSMYYIAD